MGTDSLATQLDDQFISIRFSYLFNTQHTGIYISLFILTLLSPPTTEAWRLLFQSQTTLDSVLQKCHNVYVFLYTTFSSQLSSQPKAPYTLSIFVDFMVCTLA